MSAIETSSASQQDRPVSGLRSAKRSLVRGAFGVVAEFAKVQGSQPSTWRGVVWLISSFGMVLRPEVAAAIIAAGAAVSGLIGVFAGPDAASDRASPIGQAELGPRTDTPPPGVE